ncbi:hypothetical protein FDP41_006520 [Naegleria fowleri]|uniref:Uncharacterized protein n=1 Tax=Naegleria fowleri TaxID=5763 RepID=A0A6A5BK37_NAEFO|nr:uncharacterized protein FDP41_006520 [Naegleria fowleri]KAF0974488.1 hypothetical protein FDP41_006520 [Naegleria fowleri]CAG4716981.1 unnamed protein product [Naegleria fowleri]
MCNIDCDDDDKTTRADYQFSKERTCVGSICVAIFGSLFIVLLAVVIGVNVSWSIPPPMMTCNNGYSNLESISDRLKSNSNTTNLILNFKRNIYNHYIDVSRVTTDVNNNKQMELIATLKSRSVLNYPMTIDLINSNFTMTDSFAIDARKKTGHSITIYGCNNTVIGSILQEFDPVWSDFVISNFNSRPIMKVIERRQTLPKQFDIYEYYTNQRIGEFVQTIVSWGDEWTLTLIPSSVSSVTTDVTIDRRLLLFLVSSVSYQ